MWKFKFVAMGQLKKQSQFAEWYIDIKVLQKRDYGKRPRFEGRKNKANQSQFPGFGRELDCAKWDIAWFDRFLRSLCSVEMTA